MNIKTITCHRVYNYGASLQAFALQNYLEKQGHQVEIIDFWPYFFQGRYNLLYVAETSRYYSICRRFPFLKLFYGILANRGIFKTIGRKKRFDDFENRFLHITSKRYFSSEDLKVHPPVADLFIAGSDQIWNTNMPNGYEDAFYLDFGTPDIKRMTYAASFGISEIPESHKVYVHEKCKNINVISVREDSGVEILKQCGIDHVTHVLDPVFLLTDSEWHELGKNARDYGLQRERYILLYEFIGDKNIKEIALKCSKKLKLKIVSVNDSIKLDYVDLNINDAGPCEFISLIENAALVITNSFHATAFSIMMKRNFYAYSLASQKTSGRISSICAMLGISNRFNNTQPDCNSINYDHVSAILSEKQAFAKNFLNNNLTR